MVHSDVPTASTSIPRMGDKVLIPLSKIVVESNTRKTFDGAELDELKASLRKNGQLMPVIVHERDDAYVLDAGERRFRAFTDLAREGNRHFEHIEALVRNDSSDLARRLLVQLTENAQRADLPPTEQAEAVQDYIDQAGCSAEEAAEAIGWDVKKVEQYCELATSPVYLQDFGRATLRLPYPAVDGDGNAVKDDDGNKVYKKRKVEPLNLSNLSRLVKLAQFLDKVDEKLTRENPRHRPIKEKTITSIATRAAMEGWSYKKIREEERKVRDRFGRARKSAAGSVPEGRTPSRISFSAQSLASSSHEQRIDIARQVTSAFASVGWAVDVHPTPPGD